MYHSYSTTLKASIVERSIILCPYTHYTTFYCIMMKKGHNSLNIVTFPYTHITVSRPWFASLAWEKNEFGLVLL